MTFLKVIILAIVQGLAELLPVSSSAHVVVAEKLMGLDPSAPSMTLLLVMLHTGTMFAVIVYFWRRWRTTYFASMARFKTAALQVIVATALTGVIAEAINLLVKKTLLRNSPDASIEDLFSHLELIAPALAAVGILILIAGLRGRRPPELRFANASDLTVGQASVIGAVQGLTLPFRGFSRSGATISVGMLVGVSKFSVENFSFALAVVLTPVVVGREALRVLHAEHAGGAALASAVVPSLVGAVLAFVAGLIALRWLSGWLEGGALVSVWCVLSDRRRGRRRALYRRILSA